VLLVAFGLDPHLAVTPAFGHSFLAVLPKLWMQKLASYAKKGKRRFDKSVATASYDCTEHI
jgi:hypothetical protein